jgi:hypothetical protein
MAAWGWRGIRGALGAGGSRAALRSSARFLQGDEGARASGAASVRIDSDL